MALNILWSSAKLVGRSGGGYNQVYNIGSHTIENLNTIFKLYIIIIYLFI